MAEKIVLDEFPKQTGEDRFYDCSAQHYLDENQDTLASINPYEIVPPTGLTIVADSIQTNVVKMLVRGGVNNKKYLMIVWFNMQSGARIKHEFYIMVQDVPC